MGFGYVKGALGATVNPEQVAQIVQQKLEEVPAIPAITTGGAAGEVMTKASDDDGDIAWAAPVLPAAENVRVWEAESLVFIEDFQAGFPGSPFSVTTGSLTAVTLNDPALPDFPYGLFFNGSANQGAPVTLNLDLNAIPELEGLSPVRISYWDKQGGSGSTSPRSSFKDANTTRIAPSGTYGWTKRSWPISSIDADQTWAYWKGSTGNSQYWLTGIQITAISKPYNLNELVRHDGKFYRSLRVNNISVPGTDNTWQLVP